MGRRSCGVSGCQEIHYGLGFCRLHYKRFKSHGDPLWQPPTSMAVCGVDGCTKPHAARGYCTGHYQRWRQHGDPLADRRRQRARCRIDRCGQPVHGHLLCTKHYQRWLKHGDPDWTPVVIETCQAEDCANPPRSTRAGWCEMHYYRRRRHGDHTTVREPTGRTTGSNGYQLVHVPGHRLAHTDGWAYEHRVVLFGQIGPGDHPCNWCGTWVSWDLTYPADMDALVTDHLDGDITNNRPDNLVPACNPCNIARESASGLAS